MWLVRHANHVQNLRLALFQLFLSDAVAYLRGAPALKHIQKEITLRIDVVGLLIDNQLLCILRKETCLLRLHYRQGKRLFVMT